MSTHGIETVLRSYLTGDGYIAADDIPAICADIEAALQSQDREDSERLEFITGEDSKWSVMRQKVGDKPTRYKMRYDGELVGPWFNTAREAIDHARLVEEREGTDLDEKVRYAGTLPEVECSRCGLKVISSCKSQYGCPVPDMYARRVEKESK